MTRGPNVRLEATGGWGSMAHPPWPLITGVTILSACLSCAKAQGKSTGACKSDSDCLSDECSTAGQCICDGDADCPAGEVCAQAGCPPGILCGNPTTCLVAYGGDSGCYSNYLVSGAACPTGTSCNQTDGNCERASPPVLPTCGQSDPSFGYDAGWGPGPAAGGACAACVGCPLGTECVCGVSGLAGGLSCGPGTTDAAAALACFLTGAVGECETFPGDCATNTQCANQAGKPYCSSGGSCVQCLRDEQCPQAGGAEGCLGGACGPCCAGNAECPPDAPLCKKGFCYAQCQADADCAALDAGLPHCCAALCQTGACNAGTPDGGAADGG
jgi:hypothetical protein